MKTESERLKVNYHNTSENHNSKSFIIRNYCKIKHNLVIKYAELMKDDLILDFGCGSGQLKKKLKNYRVIGYDITPEHTDINDYTLLKPDKILVIDVFEHIPIAEIKEIISDFKRMSSKFTLVVAIPTENIVCSIIRILTGKPRKHPAHITELKEIKLLLDKEFRLIKYKYLFTTSYIGVYKTKK